MCLTTEIILHIDIAGITAEEIDIRRMAYGSSVEVAIGIGAVGPHIIPILLRHFVMSLQHQQWWHTAVVDIVREPVCDRERTGRASRSKKENGNAAYASCVSCPTARDVRPGRMEGRAEGEKETGKENVKGEQGGANEWTTGSTAAECTAGSPTILRYRATALNQPVPSENGLHAFATVGREAARDERVGQRGKYLCARAREKRDAAEMEAFAAMNQAPLHGCPGRFWYRSLPRRNSKRSSPVTTSAVSRRICLPSSLPYRKIDSLR